MRWLYSSPLIALASLVANAQSYAPIAAYDNGTSGAALTIEHLFYDQMPTGIALTSNGTMFVNYPVALNSTSESNSTSVYTLARLTGNTTDVPFPSAEYNRPTGGYVNISDPSYANGDTEHFVSVQNVVVDYQDRIWVLDTGRPTVNNQMLLSNFGGPKLVGFNQDGTLVKTITFPRSVVFADSYLNDVRFDLRANASSGGQGVAYITDSSQEGRTGIVVVDIGSGECWRHLNGAEQTRPDQGFRTSYNGIPFIPLVPSQDGLGQGQYSQLTMGSDGIAISSDGAYLYFTPLASRRLYRVPTSYLLQRPSASMPYAANQAVANTQLVTLLASHADGLETDSTGVIYQGAPEHNAIWGFRPETGEYFSVVRDPRIQWPDTLFVASDNRLYFTSNQYWKQPAYNNGTDLREKPFVVLSVPIDGGRVNLQ